MRKRPYKKFKARKPKWAIQHGIMTSFFYEKPRVIPGGFITFNGHRYVGADVELLNLTEW